MNFLKKPFSVLIIFIFAIIDIKIIIDYEIIRPTEKYKITDNKKTVAEVLDLSKANPEETVENDITNSENTDELDVSEENITKNDISVHEENKQIEEVTQVVASVETPVETDPAPIETSNQLIEESALEQPVSTEQVEPSEPTPEPTPEPAPEPSNNGTDIVSTAKSYLGYNYVSGGSSPSTGFDCSGFTQYVYSQYGISLNRTAADQAANGTPISKDELQPGDLVLFSYYGSDSIGHAGIYIGDGQMVHAANSRRGVVTDTINSGYYADNYVTARRVN